jgi:predicted helicase
LGGGEFGLREILARHPEIVLTPAPLVSWVVRSVHALLRSRFGRPAGLADRDVRLLDPAAGPMNFVQEACRVALEEHRRLHGERGLRALVWGHLLVHFLGFERLAVPCHFGRWRLARFFEEQGLPLAESERISLFLTDALDAPAWQTPPPAWREGETRLPVLIGNPPWCGHSRQRSAWIRKLLHGYRLPDGREEKGYFQVDGRPLGERNPKWLQDDYVKFLRVAQWQIDQAGRGIAAYVVSHTGLDAPTFRGLRRSLLGTFDEIYALDLHGSGRRRETAPDGGPDESVFEGVAQGAAVLLLVKKPGLPRRVLRANLYGPRKAKLDALGQGSFETVSWQEIHPAAPCYLFVAEDRRREEAYRRGVPLTEIFPVRSTGVVTGRDALFVGFSRQEIEERIDGLEEDGVLAALREEPAWRQRLTPFLVRPFDLRWLLYVPRLLARPRQAVMEPFLRRRNLGLIVPRQSKEEPGALVTRWIAGHKVVSAHDVSSLFPLYLDPQGSRIANLSPGFQLRLAECYGEAPSPEAILGYVYAVLYSRPYRDHFREFLRRDFPRIPFPRCREVFDQAAELGTELIGLHLLEDERLEASAARAAESGPLLTLEVDPRIWGYCVGGYRVLQCWSLARDGRNLTRSEICRYHRAAEALRLTLEIQERLAGAYRSVQEHLRFVAG